MIRSCSVDIVTSIDHKYKFKLTKVNITGIEAFWSLERECLMKHLGISKEMFLYCIKEMEWRYNNRRKIYWGFLWI